MQLNHYLNFDGQAEAAFEFYRSIFGGEFSDLRRYGDLPDFADQLDEPSKQQILHISLPINPHTVLMASDVQAHLCGDSAPYVVGTHHYISINLEAHERAEAERIFNALSQNAEIEAELSHTFWGALFGSLKDQFGICWMVNCQLDA